MYIYPDTGRRLRLHWQQVSRKTRYAPFEFECSNMKRLVISSVTKRMKRETRKRNNQMDDFMHKKSRKIVDTCMEENVGVIVIGNHNDWKQNIHLGKKNNQNFVQLPFQKFIKIFKYKAEAVKEQWHRGTVNVPVLCI